VVDVVAPGIDIVKTAGSAADGTTLFINGAQTVTFSYKVTNTGDTYLHNITVVDDNGTTSDLTDDFTVGTITLLAPGASQTLTANRSVTADRTNIGKATGTPSDSQGTDLPGINNVSDT